MSGLEWQVSLNDQIQHRVVGIRENRILPYNKAVSLAFKKRKGSVFMMECSNEERHFLSDTFSRQLLAPSQ
jgi:hypothetical protein